MPQKHENTINYEENVLFLEIEKNDNFDDSLLSDEEYDRLKKKNEKFTHDHITTKLLANTGVCSCQMEEFTKKHMAKAKLLYGTNQLYQHQYQANVEQEDVDKFKFSVIVMTENGLMDEEPACIMRECKFCHKVDIWGDIDVLTRIVAESTANKITNQQIEELWEQEAAEVIETENPEIENIIEDAQDVEFENIEEPVENTEPAE